MRFTFIDGDQGGMSYQEMLLHVITHAAYHRGSVGQEIEDTGKYSPPDSRTKYLHLHEPERRRRNCALLSGTPDYGCGRHQFINQGQQDLP